MIIRKLHIENFGHFHDFTLELKPGLNRLRGENEFGKSTLLEFIRRVLWGFPDGRKAQLNHYPARSDAGEYGGRLEVETADGRSFRLERLGVKSPLVVRTPDGESAEGGAWLGALSPVSGDCYRSIYAVTLDELARLADLESEEIRGRLYGGAITGEGVSLPGLGRLLDDRARELYKQRNGVSRINTARQELRAARGELDSALNLCARRSELETELERLAAEEKALRREVAEVSAASAGVKTLLKAHPVYLKCRKLEAELAALPPTPEVPDTAAAEAAGLELSLETAERALPPAPPPGECERLERELAAADAELSRLARAMPPLPTGEDYAAASKLADEAVLRPHFPAAVVFALAAAAFAAAAGLMEGTARWTVPGAVLAAVAAAVALAFRARRLRRLAEWRSRCADFSAKFGLVCPPQEFLNALSLREKRERLESGLSSRREILAAHAAAGKLRGQLAELCGRCGCRSAGELRALAGNFAAARRLRAELEREKALLDSLLGAGGAQLAALQKFDPAAGAERADDLDRKTGELERSVYLLHRQTGALTNELAHLPSGGELELRRSMVESARNEVAAGVREYLVVRGCRRLLDAAVARYERESQPEVMKRAAELFAKFTSGRYPRLYRNLTSGELVVCDAETGLEKNFSALSRGTREELMIAMRLALIECTERGAEPLPVVFDDVGVNFDSRRLAAVEAAVETFSRGRQVIWFSHS